jgi:homoserine kinase type II
MAVYTKLKEEDINNILSNYSIGKLKSFKGIQEGIENTNYSLLVEEKKYILTIYEKRVNPKDLPFFSDLMTGLNHKILNVLYRLLIIITKQSQIIMGKN